jgi:hypothetical protein
MIDNADISEDDNNENHNVQQLEIEVKNDKNKDEENSKKIKYIIFIMGITLIIAALIIILIVCFARKNEEEEEMNSWDISYQKAEEFINKLNLTEKVNLLFGTQNMKGSSNIIEDESEKQYLCAGQIDPFENPKVKFKGMCLQDGPAGVRSAKGTSISWQASINSAATFNKKLMYDVGKAQGEEF